MKWIVPPDILELLVPPDLLTGSSLGTFQGWMVSPHLLVQIISPTPLVHFGILVLEQIILPEVLGWMVPLELLDLLLKRIFPPDLLQSIVPPEILTWTVPLDLLWC